MKNSISATLSRLISLVILFSVFSVSAPLFQGSADAVNVSNNGLTIRYKVAGQWNQSLPGATLKESAHITAVPPTIYAAQHGPIQSVQFKLNGQETRTDLGSPYKMLRNSAALDVCSLAPGEHLISAKANYADGFSKTFYARFTQGCAADVQPPAPAQPVQPVENDAVTFEDTARLLGYMFADGTYNEASNTWTVRTPNGTGDLVRHLMKKHGATELPFNNGFVFSLAGTNYDWDGTGWYDSVPDNNAYVSRAVRSPHFLAAVIEGEGSVWGLVSDHTTNPATDQNPNYTTARLQSLAHLLKNEHGLSSTWLQLWQRPGSGKITIWGTEDFNTIRSMPFVCPRNADHRVPGGNRDGFSEINWIHADNSSPSDWVEIVGSQCQNNPKINF